jgi:heavy metal translocating P-type ATPase
MVLCGVPIIINSVKALITKKKITAGLLVSVALIASLIIEEYFAAGEVALIMQLGGFLEALTISKARSGIKKLLSLAPDTALLKTEHGEETVATKALKVGDIIIVKAGENFPVDGIIIKGKTSINQAAITGESLPVDKAEGDEVFEGTSNTFGVIEVRVSKIGEDSSIKKMARLVSEAEKKKAPIVKIADKLASYLVPSAIVVATIVGLITSDLERAVTILVVFCPCSLVLATPTAIMASVGKASRIGIIIKSGAVIEKISQLDAVAFDKTGTITSGKLSVAEIFTDMDREEFISLATSAEKLSEHPISKAVVDYADQVGIKTQKVDEFKTHIGKGISCIIAGKPVSVGNLTFMKEMNVQVLYGDKVDELQKAGKKTLYVSVYDKVAGIIGVSDIIKPSSAESINSLNKDFGLETVMLTGDNKVVGEEIAKAANITTVYADCLPEDKVKIVESYVSKGKKLAMVGDGINDAPALATATVGIAMGAIGSDIAVESADIALMTDDLAGIPKLLRHSRRTMHTNWANIAFSMTVNVVAIILASLGTINPVISALIHNAGSVIVVLNAALLYMRK